VDRRPLGATAGIIGPVLFVTVFTVEGWLRPGYDWRSMYVSELALGPRGWVQIANFALYGVLQLVFASGMAAEFPNGTASRAGPLVLRLIGRPDWCGRVRDGSAVHPDREHEPERLAPRLGGPTRVLWLARELFHLRSAVP
jgi:hypothetical protein